MLFLVLSLKNRQVDVLVRHATLAICCKEISSVKFVRRTQPQVFEQFGKRDILSSNVNLIHAQKKLSISV